MVVVKLFHSGITPAYAGNTCVSIPVAYPCWDHPRLRGEHSRTDFALIQTKGSPPPTRGTRWHIGNSPLARGITPAYAGNTLQESRLVGLFRDHPRLRGEHIQMKEVKKIRGGSPPPTRGTLLATVCLEDIFRITPAYAGNTV